jgi:hypothetical protein
MSDKLKKEELVPGVKYKGYGMLNDYKEFIFTPEKTGSRAGREKILQSWDDMEMSLKETKNYLIVSMKLAKGTKENDLVHALMGRFNSLYNFFKTHEI